MLIEPLTVFFSADAVDSEHDKLIYKYNLGMVLFIGSGSNKKLFLSLTNVELSSLTTQSIISV